MRIYRVGNTRYAGDLSGEGARLYGGRWNHVGIPCVYTAQSRSLAVLEFSVNVNQERILRYLSMVEIEVPDDIYEINIRQLPGDWKDTPSPVSTKDVGTNLLTGGLHAVIKIPSSVIPEEYNYLINPKIAFGVHYKIIAIKDFIYDIRIKTT